MRDDEMVGTDLAAAALFACLLDLTTSLLDAGGRLVERDPSPEQFSREWIQLCDLAVGGDSRDMFIRKLKELQEDPEKAEAAMRTFSAWRDRRTGSPRRRIAV